MHDRGRVGRGVLTVSVLLHAVATIPEIASTAMKKNIFLRDLTPPTIAIPARSIPAPYPPSPARVLCREEPDEAVVVVESVTSTGVQPRKPGFVQYHR